jgi:hypothetical protein
LDKFLADNDHLTEIEKSEFDQLEAERKVDEIRLKRFKEYPPVGDALDALAKWAFTENEIGLPDELKSWAAKCMSVKSKYPIEGK